METFPPVNETPVPCIRCNSKGFTHLRSIESHLPIVEEKEEVSEE